MNENKKIEKVIETDIDAAIEKKHECIKCKGTGVIEVGADSHGIDANEEPCEFCNGTGEGN